MLCAIVDAYSTGRFLAPEFRRAGVECVHVQSRPDVSPFYAATFQPRDFADNIAYQGSTPRLADELAARGVGAVLAGAETGVLLGETLAAAMGLPGNDPRCPLARRNKALMARCLEEAGLRAPANLCTTDVAAALAWAERRGAWPVVAKPVASAGTDHVFFCWDAAGLARAFRRILASENLLGLHNEAVVVQEYLDGREYAVNTVSRNGRHHVAEVWQYTKRGLPGASVVYDYEEPLAFDDPRVGIIGDYVRRALDALGVRNGPAHSELILAERGPVLLETGARLAGAVLPAIMAAHFGTSQAALTVQAILDPDAFDALVGRPYRVDGCLRNVFLISPRAGILMKDRQFERLHDLRTFAGMSISARAGSTLRRTTDLAGAPGFVYLRSSDPESVAADYLTIRRLEATVLYPVLRGAGLPAEGVHLQHQQRLAFSR